MANKLFKGDLAEVSFGKETGLRANGNDTNTVFTLTSTTGNTSLITMGAAHSYWTTAGPDLLLPDNILVGCTMKIEGGGSFTSDDFATTKRTYYITANDTASGTITVQPALVTAVSTAAVDTDNLVIDGYRLPTFEASMITANQQVKTDQFIGLLNELKIPEPKIDVRKQHIVGMGRDVNIITSGREELSGGALQVNAHTIRWLKYALGGHTALSQGEYAYSATANTIIGALPLNIKVVTSSAKYATQLYGASTVKVGITALNGLVTTSGNATGNFLLGQETVADAGTDITFETSNYNTHFENVGTKGIFKVLSAAGKPLYGYYGSAANLVIGSCIDITSGALARAQTVDMAVYLLAQVETDVNAGDIRIDVGATNAVKFVAGTSYVQIVDSGLFTIPGQDDSVTSRQLNKHEIRRVIAIGEAGHGDAGYIYVEEAFTFDHTATECGVERLQYYADTTRGSPHIGATDKQLHFGIEHTLFGHSTLPSFTLEQSFRQTDSETDSKQLLRLYSGCKATDATVQADTEGELKIDLSYDASRHYTETTNTIKPHRMFDNTAHNALSRKSSGIIVDGEKPYLFQDISVSVFGRPVLRGTEFNLKISNSLESQYYIRGFEGNTSDNDQVQHGATQSPLEITEAAREYTFNFKALVEDDRLWEELRTRRHHRNTNDITITMIKPGGDSTRQTATITLEDYTIVSANHDVPNDKGPVTANVELVVRHMKVTESSPYFIL
tara:strand:- start:34435 stop:36627 length:2193 start_codon:yes stop_codon:yes gene_type:complete